MRVGVDSFIPSSSVLTNMRVTTKVVIIIALSLFPFSALSVELHPFLANNLVLARAPLSPRLWGWGTPGESVVVVLDGRAVDDPKQVDSDGEWMLDLPPRDASVGPHTLTLTGSESGSVTLQNVAFGGIFLCWGQSNMQFGVHAAFNASEEIANSANYPHLRLATVALIPADSPQNRTVSAANYTWAVSEPNAFAPVGSHVYSWFSATCYFFGRDLYKSLGQGVPIGIVASSWAGQAVEAFSSPDAIGDKTCGTKLEEEIANPASSSMAMSSNGFLSWFSATFYFFGRFLYKSLGQRVCIGIVVSSWRGQAVETFSSPDAIGDETCGTKLDDEITNPGSSSTAMFQILPSYVASTSQLWNGMIYPLIKMRFAGAIWCAFLVSSSRSM
jgi:hypothetical protein